MQPAELTSTSEGHPLLVLRGEEGVVSVEGWTDEASGVVVGMLTVHSPVPHAERCAAEECEFLGRCYPVFGDWPTNFTAAEYLVRGGPYLGQAELIALNWYLHYLYRAPEFGYAPGEHWTMIGAQRPAPGKSRWRPFGARIPEEGR